MTVKETHGFQEHRGEPHSIVAYYLLTCLAMRGERSQ
jgi:hypothetical protein